jgi:predicted outer membrane repeat protein
VGGAAVRVLSQFQGRPVYVVNSTFGGASGQGGVCSNGGALSSIGVSWVVLNSILSHNRAIGRGANPERPGTPGGGSGGAIYTDGDRFTVRVAGTIISDNSANEGGGAIFMVSNNLTGTMRIENSTLRRNPNRGFFTRGFPGIFFKGARNPTVVDSILR